MVGMLTWSDPDKCTGTSGTGASVPVALMFTGTAQTKENTNVEIDEVIEFQSFFEVNTLIKVIFLHYFVPLQFKSGRELLFEPAADYGVLRKISG